MSKEQKMKLYFHPLSSNSRRVTMTARQLGLEPDLIIVDLLKGEHKDPESLRFNANGRVPLLEDDGFYLWESHGRRVHQQGRVSKKVVGGSGDPDPAEIQRGEALLAAAAQVLDAHLRGRQWITHKLTLADLAIAAPLMHTAAAQLPVLEYTNLQRWFAGIQALEAWRNTERAQVGGRSWRG
jgi:glutathione S-transferase